MNEPQLRDRFVALTKQYARQRYRCARLEQMLSHTPIDVVLDLNMATEGAAQNLRDTAQHFESEGEGRLHDELAKWCAAQRAEADARTGNALREALLAEERARTKALWKEISTVWDLLRDHFVAQAYERRGAVAPGSQSAPGQEASGKCLTTL